MNWRYSIFFKICVLFVSMLLTFSFLNIQMVTGGNKVIQKNGSFLVIDDTINSIQNLDNNYEKESSNSVTSGITIKYPVPGYLYALNTEGEYKLILNLLNIAFMLDSNLEAGAEPTGDVDEVEFVLKSGNTELERKTDSSLENGIYNVRFYNINSFYGKYEITAIAKYQGQEVATDTISKVIFLQLGTPGNKPPVAVAEFESGAWQGKVVQFDGSGSYDPDGDIVSYLWNFGDGSTSGEQSPTHVYTTPGTYTVTLTVTDNEGSSGTDSGTLIVIDYDFGIWLITKYQGQKDEVKLDIGIDEFKVLLISGVFTKNYYLTMQDENDTAVTFRFGKTPISGVEAIATQLRVEIEGDTDLSKQFEFAMEFRFPYSLLQGDQPPSEDYFSARIGYAYDGDNGGTHGPHGVESFFYFGKKSLSDPGVLKMEINPYYNYYHNTFPLTYSTSFLTVDENEVEQFYRTLSVEFDPAASITVNSIPSQGKISYEFGDETAGKTTTISFRAYGGKFEDIIQRFVLDPLPYDMSFDLTILGERYFKYEASNSYDFTYLMDSEQNGNMVKLELSNLPRTMTVSWGLDINLGAKTGSGFVDLDMSGNIGAVKLSLFGDDPFIQVSNFPSKFRLSGFIDVPNLKGSVGISKYSGGQTIISVPVVFDKWKIIGSLNINDGSSTLSFDLPNSGSNYIAVGLDTNNNAMFGASLSVVDTTSNKEVLKATLGGVATDNFKISFNKDGEEISDFQWSGKITKLINLDVMIDYQGFNFNVKANWILGQTGSFSIEASKLVEINVENVEFAGIVIDGGLTLNPGSSVSVEWVRGDTGHIIVQTNDVHAKAELTFGSGTNLYIYLNVVLNPNCYVKCEWDWGNTGYFYFFTRELFTEFDFEALYAQSGTNYQYGFKIHKIPSSGNDIFTRTIKWDTEAQPVRIWWLGDEPIPSEWTLEVLWNYEWYPVPFNWP